MSIELYFREARYALRAALKKPSFLLASALTLGLGVGVITAFFAIVDAVILSPIALHRDPIVRIWKRDVERNVEQFPLSYPELQLWAARSRVFDSLAAITYANSGTTALVHGDAPLSVTMASVSADFFGVLSDGPPLLGHWWTTTDEGNTSEMPAVVSERFWRSVGGANPAFVGRRLVWPGGGRAVTVVAVAPAGFEYPAGVDIWVPIDGYYGSGTGEQLDIGKHRFAQFHFLGRLAYGVTIDQVRAELDVLNRGIVAEFPNDYRPMPVVVEPLLDATLGPVLPLAWSLFAASVLVFLAAGSNVGAMLLMHATTRQHETAVRTALGASRSRIATQTFAETGVLAAGGALCGVVIAQVVVAAARTIAAREISSLERVSLDATALTFGAIATLLWTAVVGVGLVWRFGRSDPQGLTSHWRTRVTAPTRMLRAVVAGQVAAALVVAIAAGLLVRSLVELRAVDRGFDTDNLSALELLLPGTHYPTSASRERLFTRIVERALTLPGVESATGTHLEPGTGATGMSAPMVYEGQPPEEARRNPFATFEAVLPAYFDTLGLSITRGRGFTDADHAQSPLVSIVTESVASRFWPGQDPIGKRLRLGANFPWTTVVGIAPDHRYRELTRNWLTVYFPAGQSDFFHPGWLLVRMGSPPSALMNPLRRAIADVDPLIAVSTADTVETLAARETARPVAAVTIAILFALAAIVVTVTGVYGVFSYDVALRVRELAVHSAIGASPRQLLRMILRGAIVVAATGVAGGLLTAAFLMSYLRALLFEIQPLDSLTFAGAAALLIFVVVVATLRPAARAAGTDAVVLMRSE